MMAVVIALQAVTFVVYMSKSDSERWLAVPQYKNAKCCAEINGKSLEQIRCSFAEENTSASVVTHQGPPECTCADYFYCRLVVVSSVSSNHFREIKDMIASVQTQMPNTTLIVYSLGLTATETQELTSYCNLELRTFNFDKYPALNYSRINLQHYGWKPLVVQEVAAEYEVIMYFDASVRLVSPISGSLLMYLSSLRPAFISGSLFGNGIICDEPELPDYPIVSFTHNGMLEYLFPKKSQDLPALRQELALWGHIESGCWLMWFTSEMREKILNNWVDCALHQECMAPQNTSIWNCTYERLDEYAPRGEFIGCHRYDQSALNVILYREFGLTSMDSICHTYRSVSKHFKIERHPTNHYTLCQ